MDSLYFECKIFSYGKIFICYIVEDHLETHEKSLIGEEKTATILNFRKFRCGAWWTESRWLTIDLWVEHAIGLRTRGDLISEKIRVFLVSGKFFSSNISQFSLSCCWLISSINRRDSSKTHEISTSSSCNLRLEKSHHFFLLLSLLGYGNTRGFKEYYSCKYLVSAEERELGKLGKFETHFKI